MKRLLVPERSGAGGAAQEVGVRQHVLNPRLAAFVREEISKFVDELMAEPRRAPMMVPETKGSSDPCAEQRKNRDRRRGRPMMFAWCTRPDSFKI
jgi:hypothetical protein